MTEMIIHITRKINQINVARQAERQYHIIPLYIDRQWIFACHKKIFNPFP
ncbi:hypothetical protein SEEP3036_22024 [Salmonella enterica subsp. enterica serovar Pullorum str. 13036]|nr:hypothetical protein SEEP3036_22024 [Salmonella enterica subsp. enterica serovar Pullorum str. 13036]